MLVLLVALVFSFSHPTFEEFESLYEKKYEDISERVKRRNIFKATLEKVNLHNKVSNWTMGINQFADLTEDEFRSKYLMKNAIDPKKHVQKNVQYIDREQLASSVNWTAHGAVTPVKNQGQCGSCWSFSTTGSLEGAVFLNAGSLISLSEQELVSCDSTDNGCNGGLMDNAFNWIMNNKGLDADLDYPYVSGDGNSGICNNQEKNTHIIDITGYHDVPQDNEQELMKAVDQQPVSIAVDAQNCWQTYMGGIITQCKPYPWSQDKSCGISLDHGVLLTGYGTERGQDYWIIKNSWGPGWGEDGYLRIARGACQLQAQGGMFGVLMAASYPTGATIVHN